MLIGAGADVNAVDKVQHFPNVTIDVNIVFSVLNTFLYIVLEYYQNVAKFKSEILRFLCWTIQLPFFVRSTVTFRSNVL